MGQAMLPPYSLAWGSPVLEFAVSMVGYRHYARGKGNLLQEDLCQHPTHLCRPAAASATDPTAGHCWLTPLPETSKHMQV